MIATLHDFGLYPCLRCIIHRGDINRLGTFEDVKFRTTHARTNDETCHAKVQSAQDQIFRQEHGLNSTQVETLLRDQSLVPTSASFDALTL